jgi:C_GCAxxG_C_C family probable redox protein
MKKEIAIQAFRTGYNCAQSVLAAYAEKSNIDQKMAMDISAGFGGGMAQMQETCGAVTGAYMAIGLFSGEKSKDNFNIKKNSIALMQQFTEQFKAKHGTISCKALINCDLNTEEGKQHLKEHNLYEKVCEKCIADAVEIIDQLFGK